MRIGQKKFGLTVLPLTSEALDKRSMLRGVDALLQDFEQPWGVPSQ